MPKNQLLLAVIGFVVGGLVYCLYSVSRIHLPIAIDAANQKPSRLDSVKECLAINWSNPRYCTPTENDTLTVGSPFGLPSSYLKSLGVPLRKFATIRRENLDDFVFVTAANNEYLYFVMDAIGNVQDLLPNHTIYFYDLEIYRRRRHVKKIKSLCNVIYRKFNYSRYPSHVRSLKNYAFKPLIVHEMLSEFPRVFWIDSSIRFKTRNLSLTLYEVFTSGGILTFLFTGHSNFAATHKVMYDYLPISRSAAVKTDQYDANSIYIHRTEEIYNRIIVWWVLCALSEHCISPMYTDARACNFKGNATWGECHRYDQSSINILMAHHFKYNVSRYASRHGQVDSRRRSAHRECLIVCPTHNNVTSALYLV